MRSYTIHHIDSFTQEIFSGNPTVAVLDAETLSVEEMKKIAMEMHLSECGFIFPSEKADFRLRYFTRTGDEVKFCGHATVGALCAIAKEGRFGCTSKGKNFHVETNAGVLPMSINQDSRGEYIYSFDAPKIDLSIAPYKLEEVIEALGIDPELIDLSLPLMLEKTNNYLYFAAKNLQKLGEIQLDFPSAIRFASQDQIVIFCIATPEVFNGKNHIHARGFAPLVGVPEDPFTGSMQGGLYAYIQENQWLSPGVKTVGVEQGHFMGRPGEIQMEAISHHPLEVRLHAQAFHLFKATLTF